MSKINILIKDRDVCIYICSFLTKKDVINLSKSSFKINEIINYIPFKSLNLDWTWNMQDIKNLTKYSCSIEHLSIEDCDIVDHLLLDYPRLKSLSLKNCKNSISRKSAFEKYMYLTTFIVC